MTATIFEINATYKTYETGEIVKVLSRSMNRLTILINGETLQKQFKLNDDGVEFLQLSKWETVYADDVVCDEEPQDALRTAFFEGRVHQILASQIENAIDAYNDVQAYEEASEFINEQLPEIIAEAKSHQ